MKKSYFLFIGLLILFVLVSLFNLFASFKIQTKDEMTIDNKIHLKFERYDSKMLLHFQYIGDADKTSISSIGSPIKINRFKVLFGKNNIFVPYKFSQEKFNYVFSQTNELIFETYRDSFSSNAWGDYNNFQISYLTYMPSLLYFIPTVEFTLTEEFSSGEVVVTHFTTDKYKKNNEKFFYFEPLITKK